MNTANKRFDPWFWPELGMLLLVVYLLIKCEPS